MPIHSTDIFHSLLTVKTMKSVSVFQDFVNNQGNLSLLHILQEIKNGRFQEDIANIQMLIDYKKRSKANQLKKKLLAFTPSGTFTTGGRTMEHLLQYSGFIVLDLDHLPREKLESIFQKACVIPFTFACFRSPSGGGLKVLVEVSSPPEDHEAAFTQLADFYEQQLEVNVDRSGKDVTRLCFYSSDPRCFISDSHQLFQVDIHSDTPIGEVPGAANSNPEDRSDTALAKDFDSCVSFTERKQDYHVGNRNNFIYALACNCNRKGIAEGDTLSEVLKKYDLDEKEVRASVRSAYRHHKEELGKFSKPGRRDDSLPEEALDEEDPLLSTPTIPEEVYRHLPGLLTQGYQAFEEDRERDVFLTGALTILSGCLPNVSGEYDSRTVYPQLYSFIVAPAASGKGALLFAKNLGDVLHDKVRAQSQKDLQQYEMELESFKESQRTKKKEAIEVELPLKPPLKVLFIPANSSSAKVLKHLEWNDGRGIICETEADSMSNTISKEWGSYSDLLRKAFHHEKVSYSRKMNDELIEVKQPQVAVALSGTPNQVSTLIHSAEDGLFSRFIFYVFKAEQHWKDVSPNGSTGNLNQHFEMLGRRVVELDEFLRQQSLMVCLTEQQWKELNQSFSFWMKEAAAFVSDSTDGMLKRYGLICYRIAVILTTLRAFESGEAADDLYCTDQDFKSALKLSKVYLQHSLLMFNNLPHKERDEPFKGANGKRKLFMALPKSFTRSEAVALGEHHGFSPRTVDAFLKKLTGKYVERPKYGCYQKK